MAEAEEAMIVAFRRHALLSLDGGCTCWPGTSRFGELLFARRSFQAILAAIVRLAGRAPLRA